MSTGKEIAIGIFDEFTDIKVKELIEKRPWMEACKFTLLTKTIDIEQYIDQCIEKGLCVLDLETTGLNTRKARDGKLFIDLVGVCLATSSTEGVYIPVGHEDKEFNVPLKFILRELARLCANCRCIYHNFKYDAEILRNYGIIIEDADMYEDTLLMAAIQDASRKDKGLKYLVEHLLGREMIEITELGIQGTKKKVVAFNMVPPQKAVYYGAGDAMCTFGLYEYLKQKLDEMDPTGKRGSWFVYNKIEKRCLFVTMEMERNLAKIDREYLHKVKVDVIDRIKKAEKTVYDMAGRQFDINSPKQLGTLLFDEMKIPYPSKEKTATGQYITNEKVIGSLEGKYPIVDMILSYRGYIKILETYIENMLKNADENDEIKFNLNQVKADTGRFSSSGGQGLKDDGYSGVNCQNIPNYDPDDPEAIDLRRAVIARLGYKMASIDYSGEELRVAANLSKEPKWIKEFLYGSADLHTKTAQAVTGKTEISKSERKNAKTLNFHILYGGGAGGFAARAKIPYDTAKKMLINFFKEFDQLKKWIDREAAASKKRGYSLTSFGRRRPLLEFYNNTDPKVRAKGDRCAINSAIQGGSADLIKIALYRVWKWIHENGLQDDVRILAPIHDEILFEIKEDKLDALIPEICTIMRMHDVTKKLGWAVPLDVDAEYGDSFHVDHNFWEERKKRMEEAAKEPAIPEEIAVEASQPETLNATSEPVNSPEPVAEQTAEKEVPIEEAEVPVTPVPENAEVQGINSTVNNAHQYYLNITVKNAMTEGVSKKEDVKNILEGSGKSKDAQPVFMDAHIKDRIDSKGYFNYPIDIDSVSALKLRFILDIITTAGDSVFIGPKYKICVVSKDGEVYYRTSETMSIDAFMALCLAFNI